MTATFHPGQTVKFKQASVWYTAFGTGLFEIIGNMRDYSGKLVMTMYELRHDGKELYAHADELELVLPAVIATGIAAGVGDWWSARTADMASLAVEGAKVAVDVAVSSVIPESSISIPKVSEAGTTSDIGAAEETTSWTDDLLASVGSTITKVHESTAGVLSSAVDTTGSLCVSVGDTIGSVAGGLGDAACAVGEGIGAVAEGAGELIGGIADAL